MIESAGMSRARFGFKKIVSQAHSGDTPSSIPNPPRCISRDNFAQSVVGALELNKRAFACGGSGCGCIAAGARVCMLTVGMQQPRELAVAAAHGLTLSVDATGGAGSHTMRDRLVIAGGALLAAALAVSGTLIRRRLKRRDA